MLLSRFRRKPVGPRRYSEQSRRLAEILGEKAAANLRRSGYEVERAKDGSWKILSRPGEAR